MAYFGGELQSQIGDIRYARTRLPVALAVAADLNCDGAINALDIHPFVRAMTDSTAYYLEYSDCNHLNGDINCDGVVNALDISPCVRCLTVKCPECP